ncbi:amidase [Parasphingopyxis marina]|uniref:Amidase n=1 Tax=Parasphingopyxis marina TaxID=2761622 RepID=A0A842I2J1_9SPHN|nr:amidase [Parasphingopyxis marina]MBC2778949.1 amidase [Parasphingopyxis marina]
MKFEEYSSYDAMGLADLVASGETTPGELLDAALARTADVNPVINAITVDLEEQARAAIDAGLPDGPLRGVPFPIKDLTVQMEGTVTSAGSRLFENKVADQDSAIVTSYRAAGLSLFAKTNAPELGLAAVTEPVLHGPTRNPWNLDRTPGGSSGGASAAVASGIVPAAHASDGGGSIRIPASCCGLFGMKPTRGRVSLAPSTEGWGGLAVQHALTRTVRDSAMLLDIASGPRPGDHYWLAKSPSPFVDEVGRQPGPLRIGFTTDALIHGALDPVCKDAVLDAARLCEELGHNVEEARPPVDFVEMAIAANVLVTTSVVDMLESEAATRGTPIEKGELEHLTWMIYQDGQETKAHEYLAAQAKVIQISRKVAAFFEDYDVLLLATVAQPPVAVGYLDTNAEDLSTYAERLFSWIPNTQPFNVTGQPAMNMPLTWSEEGLPIGVQFAGRFGDEATLFRLAGQIESARPWAQRFPAKPFRP